MTWMGRPIEDLSRDELLTVIRWQAEQMDRERQEHIRSMDFMSDVVRAK